MALYLSIGDAKAEALGYYASKHEIDVNLLELVENPRLVIQTREELSQDFCYEVQLKTTNERIGIVLIGRRIDAVGFQCWPADNGIASPIDICTACGH